MLDLYRAMPSGYGYRCQGGYFVLITLPQNRNDWKIYMKDHLVLKVVGAFLTPFILMFALYVQLHGEVSPGGGFQAGVIFAVVFVLFCLMQGLRKMQEILSLDALRVLAALGVLLYAGVGVYCAMQGANFLDYDVIDSHDPAHGQHLGIMLVELGVGITVFAVMLMLFSLFVARKEA